SRRRRHTSSKRDWSSDVCSSDLIHVLSQLDILGVDPKGLIPAGQIGPVHGNAAVEAAGPQQCLVEDLRPVGGGQNDDALAGVERSEERRVGKGNGNRSEAYQVQE